MFLVSIGFILAVDGLMEPWIWNVNEIIGAISS